MISVCLYNLHSTLYPSIVDLPMPGFDSPMQSTHPLSSSYTRSFSPITETQTRPNDYTPINLLYEVQLSSVLSLTSHITPTGKPTSRFCH